MDKNFEDILPLRNSGMHLGHHLALGSFVVDYSELLMPSRQVQKLCIAVTMWCAKVMYCSEHVVWRPGVRCKGQLPLLHTHF